MKSLNHKIEHRKSDDAAIMKIEDELEFIVVNEIERRLIQARNPNLSEEIAEIIAERIKYQVAAQLTEFIFQAMREY